MKPVIIDIDSEFEDFEDFFDEKTINRRTAALSMDKADREKINDANRKKIFTPEIRAAISKGNKGKMITEETRDKMSKAHLGKVSSDLTKEKVRNARIGTTRTPETIAKMIEARKGFRPTTESIDKRTATRKEKGFTQTQETRELMREKALVREKVTCPHCGIMCVKGLLIRSHGDRCWLKGKKAVSYVNNKKEATYSTHNELLTAGFDIFYVKTCAKIPGKQYQKRTWKLQPK